MFTGTDIATVVGQLIILSGVLISGRWALQAKKDSALTLDQVQNDHKSNLRDNLDVIEAKVDRTNAKVDQVQVTQEEHTEQIQQLTRGKQENRADIDWLIDENTEQRRRRADEQWRPPLPGGRRDRRSST